MSAKLYINIIILIILVADADFHKDIINNTQHYAGVNKITREHSTTEISGIDTLIKYI